MFCSNCGKEIPEGMAFCGACGEKVGVEKSSYNPAGRRETLVVEVSKEREQKTITNYQKMGWTLTNNQEVNITSVYGSGSAVNGNGSTIVTSSTKTYIKLTFERNTSMKNFAELDRAYKEYTAREAEYNQKQTEIQSKGFSVKWFLIVGIAITLIGLLISIINENVRDFYFVSDGFFSSETHFSFGMFALLLLIFLITGSTCGIIVAPIVGGIEKSRLKKAYIPIFIKLNSEMDAIASEAEKYL